MMKRLLWLVMIVLMVGCQQNQESAKQPPDPPGNTIDIETYFGRWLYGQDAPSFLYLSGDGTFTCNDPLLFDIEQVTEDSLLIGEWTAADNRVSLRVNYYLANDKAERIRAYIEGDLVEGQLVLMEKRYDKDPAPLVHLDKFVGEWQRTQVHQADTGYISISKNLDSSLSFKAEVNSGGHTGSLSSKAIVVSDKQAVYILEEEELDLETVYFSLTDQGLVVETSPGISNMFGMGVYMDGLYTQDEPVYTNANIMLDTFKTEDRLQILRDLLGEEGFSFMDLVMTSGYQTNDDTLTYSGSVTGVGYGLDIIMTEDDYVYCLISGQGDKETYYTNDPRSKGLMHPDLIQRVRDLSNIRFVYNDLNESMVFEDYVWIRGQYSKPSSWEESIRWERDKGEYIEVIVSQEIFDFKVVALDFDEDINLFPSETLYQQDRLDQTFVMETYHPEGIPSESLMFKDQYGRQYSFVIAERSLRGDLFDLNELIIPLDYQSRNHLIKSRDDSYLEVPYLKNLGESLEAFIPEGWTLMDKIDLDFNGDGYQDQVGVLNKISDDQIGPQDYPRILFALRGGPSGFELDFQDINLVRTADEGGIFGDPYLPLTTDGLDFEINTYGGSAWRWSERTRFTYKDGTWYLKEKEDTYGYEDYVTSYSLDDYSLGLGHRKERSDAFDQMDLGPGEFDLEFTVDLAVMPSLKTYSSQWWLSPSRLGYRHLTDVTTKEGIDPISKEDLELLINDTYNIEDINKDYILFHLRDDEKSKEYLVRYNRHWSSAHVILVTDRFKGQYDSLGQARLGQDGLYYVKNHLLVHEGGSHVEKATLYKLDLYGNHQEVVSLDNQALDGVYPYFSLYIETLEDQLIIRQYKGDSSAYYRINQEDLKVEFLGQVMNE